MQPDKITAVYFSATGTTKKIATYIARSIAERFELPLNVICFNSPESRTHIYEFAANELVVFGLPVYAGRIPNVLLPFIKSGFVGKKTPVIPIVLYGNRSYDDALTELSSSLESNGFIPFAAGAFVGEHSFSHKLSAGRPDYFDMCMADNLVDIILKRLSENDLRSVKVGGHWPIRPYYTPRDRKGNPVNILKVKPKTDTTKCSNCGKCAAICPMGSISPDNPSEVNGICIKCCACVKGCPSNAKYYDDERYIYHKTELEEGFSRRAPVDLF